MTTSVSAQLIDRTLSLLETLPIDRLQRVYELVATMAGGRSSASVALTIDQLAMFQGVDMNTRIGDVVLDFWPEDDSVDEFSALRRVQREAAIKQAHAQLNRLP